jgi:hypothetical protein
MREIRTSGSGEGVLSNGHPYSDSRVCRRRVLNPALGYASSIAAIAVRARSSISSAMAALQAHPQILQRPSLELLDCSVRFSQRPGHVQDAPSLAKTHFDHAALIGGKALHQLKQHRAAFQIRIWCFDIRRRVAGLTRRLLPTVGKLVRRNSEEPRHKRNASPLVLLQIGKRPMKHFGRHVLGLGPTAGATDDVGIHAVKMAVVQVEKARGFGLRRFHQAAFVQLIGDQQLCALVRVTASEAEKLRPSRNERVLWP